MANYTIVAIPSQDDYVWRLSSEKIPHMTLMFLGDHLDNIPRVEVFIKHVLDTSLTKFGMDVENRGVLGPQDADVLFFGEHNKKKVEDVRRYLLNDPNVCKAYGSIEQYPEFVPHLTMGYPATPAKPDTRDYPGISWVNFDRVALWTGDYEGEEFPLKNNDLAMADRGMAFLSHYGIKGMHWGVRKPTATEVGSAAKKVYKKTYAPSHDAVRSKEYMTRAKIGGVRNLSNAEMRLVINRMALEKQYKDLYGERQLHTKGARWLGNFLNDVGKDAASSWLKRPGSNVSGRTTAAAYAWGQQIGGVLDAPRVVKAKAISR